MSPAGPVSKREEPRGVRSPSRRPALAFEQVGSGPHNGGDGEDFCQRQNHHQAEPDIKTWIDLRSP